MVLGHDIDGGGGRDGGREKIEDGGRAGQVIGQDEVPDEQAVNGQAVADFEVADLTMHLEDGGAVHFGVIARGGAFFGRVRGGEFHVGHVDVDHSVEEPEGFEVVVAAGVVDNGERQSAATGFDDGLGNRRGKVRGGNEIDIDATEALEVEHDLDELIDGEVAAATTVADIGVLAEDATEVTSGKEDRARTAGADQDRFFSEVWAGRTDAGGGADTTKTVLIVSTMRLTMARTK